MKKKAQTEIIGVAIIVVILVVAGFFFISMQSKKQSSSQGFTDPELAQSLVNAIMNTKTENNMVVSDMIKDCYKRNDFCKSTVASDCCEYARQTMANALESTLGKWKRSYRLTVIKGSDKRIKDIPENSECNEFSEQEQPGISYIPPPQLIIITLQICKG